jgi:hypothetical protein
LAAQKGLKAERHYWRGRVRLICCNGATLKHYPEGYSHGLSWWQHGHAWRFLRELPDADPGG